jgi:hypothetical protein
MTVERLGSLARIRSRDRLSKEFTNHPNGVISLFETVNLVVAALVNRSVACKCGANELIPRLLGIPVLASPHLGTPILV